MLVLGGTESYKWPVKVEAPVDGGKKDASEFIAVFKRLDQTRIDEIRQAAVDERLKDADLLDEVWLGWDKVKDEGGAAVPVTAEGRAAILNVPGARDAIVFAFFDSISSGTRKNLSRPRGS